MATGLKMVKDALGADALILSTRTIKNGKLGLLGRPVLEITAAVDTSIPREHNKMGHEQKQQSPGKTKAPAARQDFSCVVDETVTPPPYDHASSHYQPPAREAKIVESTNQSLESEVNELKELVKDLTGQLSKITTKDNTESRHAPTLKVSDTTLANRAASGIIHGDHLLSLLVERGINIETSRTIAGFLRESLTEQELCDNTNVKRAIIESIQNLIEVNPPDFTNRTEQQRIAFVGPTGVGKTTTLAKICASYLKNYSGSIALITIDTYRIAAVEQLKVYGEIMHLPVDVVITPEQLKEAIAKHNDRDLILIDTAGRSPKDNLCIEELATFLQPELNIDKHLVLSAATRENEILTILDRFNSLGISNTIFSKIDECSNLGILLNIQIQNSNPLSYLTNGQRVPEDLLEITPETVANLIMSQHQGPTHE